MKTIYTLAEVKKIRTQEQFNGMKMILYPMLNFMCLELLDNFGFTREQTKEFAKRLETMIESMNKGNFEINEVKSILKEEYDFELEVEK